MPFVRIGWCSVSGIHHKPYPRCPEYCVFSHAFARGPDGKVRRVALNQTETYAGLVFGYCRKFGRVAVYMAVGKNGEREWVYRAREAAKGGAA